MNFIFISPNFPVRYFKWVEALKGHGISVLGIGDSPSFDLHPRLKAALTDYFYVRDMSSEEDMAKAVASYQKKYGRIDFIESDNEWWLEMDAALRKRFQVTTGFWPDQMEHIKAKSAMKKYFEAAGVKTMRYLVVNGPEDKEKAAEFQRLVDWPLFVKPNVGVGAHDSYALENQADFDRFFSQKLSEPHIIEEYVKGTIVSFDGVCDSHGEVVFCTSDHFPTPVADEIQERTDFYYYNNPFSLPFYDLDGPSFEKAGRAVVKSFGIKSRFFHIEFFVLDEDRPGLAEKGEFVGLETNMRPAGGYTPDLIDFANSLSCYEVYADVIAYDENRQDIAKPKYFAFASARRDCLSYLHTSEEILAAFKDALCMYGRYPAHMADAMGDEYYYAKFDKYVDGLAFDSFVRAKSPGTPEVAPKPVSVPPLLSSVK